jgi:hypothetical protein
MAARDQSKAEAARASIREEIPNASLELQLLHPRLDDLGARGRRTDSR